jgi:hypothetical protein
MPSTPCPGGGGRCSSRDERAGRAGDGPKLGIPDDFSRGLSTKWHLSLANRGRAAMRDRHPRVRRAERGHFRAGSDWEHTSGFFLGTMFKNEKDPFKTVWGGSSDGQGVR